MSAKNIPWLMGVSVMCIKCAGCVGGFSVVAFEIRTTFDRQLLLPLSSHLAFLSAQFTMPLSLFMQVNNRDTKKGS